MATINYLESIKIYCKNAAQTSAQLPKTLESDLTCVRDAKAAEDSSQGFQIISVPSLARLNELKSKDVYPIAGMQDSFSQAINQLEYDCRNKKYHDAINTIATLKEIDKQFNAAKASHYFYKAGINYLEHDDSERAIASFIKVEDFSPYYNDAQHMLFTIFSPCQNTRRTSSLDMLANTCAVVSNALSGIHASFCGTANPQNSTNLATTPSHTLKLRLRGALPATNSETTLSRTTHTPSGAVQHSQ